MAKLFRGGHAVVIGVANYPNVSRLPGIVIKDATDVADLLVSTTHCGYPENQVTLIKDSAATKFAMRAALKQLADITGADDTALVFFSGHGARVDSGADAGTYLVPFDCRPDRLRDTALPSEELTALLQAIKARKLVVILDACHSAGAGEVKDLGLVTGSKTSDGREVKSGLDKETLSALSQGVGRVIIASSRLDEVSLILPGMPNSLFTFFLLEALKGAASSHGDGVVRVFDIFHYVSAMVASKEPSQHPIFKSHDLENNFPLSLYLGGKLAYELESDGVSAIQGATLQRRLNGRARLELTKRMN